MPSTDPEALRKEIRARMLPRQDSAAEAPSAPPPELRTEPDWAVLREVARSLRQTQALVGTMPPQPPTLRGRVGAWLIAIVRRMLFWYTPHIVHFQAAVADAIEALERGLEAESAACAAGQRSRVAEQEGLADRLQRSRAEDGRRIQELASRLAACEQDLARQQRTREESHGRLQERLAGLEHEIQRQQRSSEESQGRLQERLAGLEHEVRRQQQAGEESQKLALEFAGRLTALEQEQLQHQRALHELAEQGKAAAAEINRQLLQRTGEAERAVARMKADLIAQERRLSILLEEARRRLPEPFQQPQLEVLVSEDRHKIDAFYASFEDAFRGSREDIRQRQRVYLPHLLERGIGRPGMPILDLGCGRGEWLELLRDEGLEASGVDSNRVMVARCASLGLKVCEGDAVPHLRALPPASLGAVTAFHLLEHLPFPVVIDLLDEAVRVLQPGGLLIFETPNPSNVLVATEQFYYDPTHRHPLPSLLMQSVTELRGLCKIEILPLHPWPEAFRVPDDSELAQRFNDLLYGPQDYGLIATKC